MIYEFSCECGEKWEECRPLKDYKKPSKCKCGLDGRRILSALPSYFNRTHPDIKQDMHEMIAGIPGNLEEV